MRAITRAPTAANSWAAFILKFLSFLHSSSNYFSLFFIFLAFFELLFFIFLLSRILLRITLIYFSSN